MLNYIYFYFIKDLGQQGLLSVKLAITNITSYKNKNRL